MHNGQDCLRLLLCNISATFWALYCIADFEYLMMYHVIRYRRGIVRKNLTTSFQRRALLKSRLSRRNSIVGL